MFGMKGIGVHLSMHAGRLCSKNTILRDRVINYIGLNVILTRIGLTEQKKNRTLM